MSNGTRRIRSPGAFLRRLWRELREDSATETAAQLAYYFLLSLFPLLFFAFTLSAYFPTRDVLRDLLDRAGDLIPRQAHDVISQHVETLFGKTRPKLLTFSLLFALWSASRGVDALRRALNVAYDIPETRPYWRTQLIAVVMTSIGAVLTIAALSVFALGGDLGQWLAEWLHVGRQFHTFWSWMRWPFTTFLVILNSDIAYWLLPAIRRRFRFFTAGSAVSAVLWLLCTWGFARYVSLFGKLNATYGSIGGVVVLMIWLYLAGLVLIVGGEINSLLESRGAATAEQPLPGTADTADKRTSTAQRLWRQLRARHAARPP